MWGRGLTENLRYINLYAGLLADEMGSYVPAFYMTGIFILMGASVIFLVPFIKSESQRDVNDIEELIVVEKCTVI